MERCQKRTNLGRSVESFKSEDPQKKERDEIDQPCRQKKREKQISPNKNVQKITGTQN